MNKRRKTKSIIIIAIFIIILVSFIIVRINSYKELKILCIGNSFNQDTMAYLPPVINEILPNYKITYGTCYTGSAELSDHITWFYEDKKYTSFNYWGLEKESWRRYSGKSAKTLRQVLEKEDWDIITIQGNSSDVISDQGVEKMISNASNLAKLLKDNVTYQFDLMWFEWASRPTEKFDDYKMYDLIHQASIEASNSLDILTIIPVGTAIQNARGLSSLAEIGDSTEGKLLYSDNIHLQAGLPAMLATYTTAAAILEYLGYDPSLLEKSSWMPTEDNVIKMNASNGKGGGMTHGELRGISADNIEYAKEIAIKTVKES